MKKTIVDDVITSEEESHPNQLGIDLLFRYIDFIHSTEENLPEELKVVGECFKRMLCGDGFHEAFNLQKKVGRPKKNRSLELGIGIDVLEKMKETTMEKALVAVSEERAVSEGMAKKAYLWTLKQPNDSINGRMRDFLLHGEPVFVFAKQTSWEPPGGVKLFDQIDRSAIASKELP